LALAELLAVGAHVCALFISHNVRANLILSIFAHSYIFKKL